MDIAGTITALKVQQKNKERVSVFLDGEYAFGVTLDVAARLHKGQQLTPAEIEELRRNDDVDRAFQAALHFLGARPRSRAEVEQQLARKGHAPEAVAAALSRLERYDYVDDAGFARFWVDNRKRFRPRSAAALRFELRQKGLDRETIERALDDLDEDAAAWDALAPKIERWRDLPQEEFEKKAIPFLARRGFNFETARSACRRAWKQIQSAEDA